MVSQNQLLKYYDQSARLMQSNQQHTCGIYCAFVCGYSVDIILDILPRLALDTKGTWHMITSCHTCTLLFHDNYIVLMQKSYATI